MGNLLEMIDKKLDSYYQESASSDMRQQIRSFLVDYKLDIIEQEIEQRKQIEAEHQARIDKATGYEKERLSLTTPDFSGMSEPGLEEPWINPIDAFAGGASMGGRLGYGLAKKAGIKGLGLLGSIVKHAGIGATGSLVAEPFVGGAQAGIDEYLLKGLPGYIRMPANVVTGMGASIATNKAGKALWDTGKSTIKKIKGIDDANPPEISRTPIMDSGQEFVKKEFNKRFMEEPDTVTMGKEPLVDMSTIAKEGEPSLSPNTLYTNPFMPKEAAKLVSKVGQFGFDLFFKKMMPKAVQRMIRPEFYGDMADSSVYHSLKKGIRVNKDIGIDYGIGLGKRLQEHSVSDQLEIGNFIRNPAYELRPELQNIATETVDVLKKLGRQALDEGLLDEETFYKNIGRYMPRLYTSKELAAIKEKYKVFSNEMFFKGDRFKKLKDIDPKVRKEMGEILTPGYPIAKGIVQITNDIESARWFGKIAENPEWAHAPTTYKQIKNKQGFVRNIPVFDDSPINPNFKQLKTDHKFGKLSGAYVHEEIYNELTHYNRVMGGGEKKMLKALGLWKMGKVILSPKTHMRNVISNSMFSHLGGQPLWEQPKYHVKAFQEMRNKGKYWESAYQNGLMSSTYAKGELNNMLDQVLREMGGVPQGHWMDGLGVIGKRLNDLSNVTGAMAKAYRIEEEFGKLSKFIHNIEKKGMSHKAAATDAQKWLFDYSDLTVFQKKFKDHLLGAPFATFTFKAAPRLVESAIVTPWRWATPLLLMKGFEELTQKVIGDTDEQLEIKKGLKKDYMKGGLPGLPSFTRVPITDKDGREYWLNLRYMMPWGDQGQAFGGSDGPVGNALSLLGGVAPLQNPITKEIAQQLVPGGGYDFYFGEPIVDPKKMAGKSYLGGLVTGLSERLKHGFNTFAPTPFMDQGKIYDAMGGWSGDEPQEDYRGRVRPKSVVAADVGLGIKMVPVHYKEEAARKIRQKTRLKNDLTRDFKKAKGNERKNGIREQIKSLNKEIKDIKRNIGRL